MSDTWVYGYGSLVWRPDFPVAERVPARLEGWQRRLWQGSPDHRGTPERPGRVATLVAARQRHVHGVAFRLQPGTEADTLARLDVREVAGYAQLRVPLTLTDGRSLRDVLTYIATPDNPWFLGDAPPATIALQVLSAAGPSGPNAEYVNRLVEALASMGVHDAHLSAVHAAMRHGCR